jgi:hypothetical protein
MSIASVCVIPGAGVHGFGGGCGVPWDDAVLPWGRIALVCVCKHVGHPLCGQREWAGALLCGPVEEWSRGARNVASGRVTGVQGYMVGGRLGEWGAPQQACFVTGGATPPAILDVLTAIVCAAPSLLARRAGVCVQQLPPGVHTTCRGCHVGT